MRICLASFRHVPTLLASWLIDYFYRDRHDAPFSRFICLLLNQAQCSEVIPLPFDIRFRSRVQLRLIKKMAYAALVAHHYHASSTKFQHITSVQNIIEHIYNSKGVVSSA